MRSVKVNLKNRSYSIVIGSGAVSSVRRLIRETRLGQDAAVITNRHIWRLFGNKIRKTLREYNPVPITIPDAETSKSNSEAVRILEAVVRIDKAGGIFIVALGGGVVGDVAGFVASVYKRGIPYIQVPTTLLAQVDSAIGGKVAIDLACAKNLVGAFYQPRIVISDTDFLRSLPARQMRSGLAEVIKYGVIEDSRLFGYLEENLRRVISCERLPLEFIVYRSSAIKASFVRRDEYDRKGIRAKLNYGHTIGHAIEAATGYSGSYSHGEAIAIGMIAAVRIAEALGALDRPSAQRIADLIRRAGLPVTISRKIDIDRVMKAQAFDKKRLRGKNRFVLPRKIGKADIFEDVPQRLILDVIKSMQE